LLLAACQTTKSVSGVLTGVESTGISEVQAVTLRAEDGTERRYVVSGEAARSGHPPSAGHLRQHMTHGDRVTVTYRDSTAGPIAVEIVDS
jgi:hypothetical protein